jgi:hypothetical protein
VSDSGFSMVLHQGSGSVAFFSKSIAPHHAKLTAYERELISLVYAIRHWRPYLRGHPSVIRTDHYSLKFLLDQKLSTISQHQWASKLLDFDFRVEYKPGVTNVVADALSRHDSETGAELSTLSAPNFILFDTLRQENGQEPKLCQLREDVLVGSCDTDWKMVDNLIMVNGRVYLLATSSVFPEALASAHRTSHKGVERTLHRFRVDFHVPGSRTIVQDYVRTCATC